ncbi:MAG: GGDEF domain-containing protein, partial [Bradymonadaceae bacterium]
VAERLHRRIGELAEPFDEVDFGSSLGVACFEQPPEDVEDVVRLADAAMYEAKRSPHWSVVVWEAGDPPEDQEVGTEDFPVTERNFGGAVEWGEVDPRDAT